MKKASIFVGILGAFFILAPIAQAQWAVIITGQAFKGDYSTPSSSPLQGVGTGLNGVVTSIEFERRYIVSSGGNVGALIILNECTSAYAGCSIVATTTRETRTLAVGTQVENWILQMSTSYTLNPARWYTIQIDESATYTGSRSSSGTTAASPAYQHGTGQAIVSDAGGLVATYYSLIGEYDANGIAIGSATSSSIFSGQTASSTLEDLADQCSWASNLFAEGLCVAFSFLFVPSPSTLDNFTQLPEVAAEKFPFSWVYGVKQQFASLTASSTSNMVSLSYNFHNLGIGSTTPMGNILPNVTVFSSSTILTYISPTLWANFQLLIAATLWLMLIGYIFNQARRLAQPRV